MRRIASLILLVGLLLSGCSYADVMKYLPATPTAPPPTPSPTATVYVTPTLTPSITPTLPTPTFTLTPTLVYPNGTPTSSVTPTEVPTLGLGPTTTETPSPQPLGSNGPFDSIQVSGQQMFWGKCDPNSVKATVRVSSGVPAAWVLIELRLKDVATSEVTDWGGGAIMDKQGNGVFTYTLTAQNFEHYRDYRKSWGQYQFVALDAYKHRLGASSPFLSNLTLLPCP